MTLDIRDHYRTHVELERAGSFPPYDVCNDTASSRIMGNVAERIYDCSIENLLSSMLIYIRDHEAAATDINEEDFNVFNLVLPNYSVISSKVFINYAEFNPCFALNGEDLVEKFSNVYVPSVDDLDVVDTEFRWIVHITHERDVYVKFAAR